MAHFPNFSLREIKNKTVEEIFQKYEESIKKAPNSRKGSWRLKQWNNAVSVLVDEIRERSSNSENNVKCSILFERGENLDQIFEEIENLRDGESFCFNAFTEGNDSVQYKFYKCNSMYLLFEVSQIYGDEKYEGTYFKNQLSDFLARIIQK